MIKLSVDIKIHMGPSLVDHHECRKEGKSPATEISFHILDPDFFWVKNVLMFLSMEHFSGELFGRTDSSWI